MAISQVFPNATRPQFGIFTAKRLSALAAARDIADVRVIVPIPTFPAGPLNLYRHFRSIPRKSAWQNLQVFYPRFLNIPGSVGRLARPKLMARAVAATVNASIRESGDFDVLDAFFAFPDGVAASIIAKKLRKPLVITAFGNDLSLIPKVSSCAASMIRRAAIEASAVTAVADALAKEWCRLGIPRRKVHVVRHGVDLNLFRPVHDRTALKEQLGIGKDLLFVSAGHLIERKGHHIAIEALAAFPDARLAIAGEGPLRDKLESLARRLNVSGRILMLGEISQDILAKWFAAADVVVLMSSREGLPNVINEALACGTPVVATAVWGTPEVLSTPVVGRLVYERTPEALITEIEALLSRYPRRSAVRQYARAFTWDSTTAQHLEVYHKVL